MTLPPTSDTTSLGSHFSTTETVSTRSVRFDLDTVDIPDRPREGRNSIPVARQPGTSTANRVGKPKPKSILRDKSLRCPHPSTEKTSAKSLVVVFGANGPSSYPKTTVEYMNSSLIHDERQLVIFTHERFEYYKWRRSRRPKFRHDKMGAEVARDLLDDLCWVWEELAARYKTGDKVYIIGSALGGWAALILADLLHVVSFLSDAQLCVEFDEQCGFPDQPKGNLSGVFENYMSMKRTRSAHQTLADVPAPGAYQPIQVEFLGLYEPLYSKAEEFSKVPLVTLSRARHTCVAYAADEIPGRFGLEFIPVLGSCQRNSAADAAPCHHCDLNSLSSVPNECCDTKAECAECAHSVKLVAFKGTSADIVGEPEICFSAKESRTSKYDDRSPHPSRLGLIPRAWMTAETCRLGLRYSPAHISLDVAFYLEDMEDEPTVLSEAATKFGEAVDRFFDTPRREGFVKGSEYTHDMSPVIKRSALLYASRALEAIKDPVVEIQSTVNIWRGRLGCAPFRFGEKPGIHHKRRIFGSEVKIHASIAWLFELEAMEVSAYLPRAVFGTEGAIANARQRIRSKGAKIVLEAGEKGGIYWEQAHDEGPGGLADATVVLADIS